MVFLNNRRATGCLPQGAMPTYLHAQTSSGQIKAPTTIQQQTGTAKTQWRGVSLEPRDV